MQKSIAIALLILLSGCEDHFRYPCQDPTNWDKKECKPPICSVTATCPEQLVKINKDKP